MAKQTDKEIFESLGRIIGYLHLIPFSIVGFGLIIFGIITGFDSISSADQQTIGAPARFDGDGIFSGLCILSGAILQASKSLRKH